MSEHAIQNTIRNALAGTMLLFRANVGRGWISTQKAFKAPKSMMYPLERGDVVLKAARPFDTGLPPGFSDLFGLKSVEVTPDMVGQRVAIFVALEVKDEDGRAKSIQKDFLKAVNDNGGRAGVVRSVEDALRVVGM